MRRYISFVSLGAIFSVLSGCAPTIHKAVINGDYNRLESMVSRKFPSKEAKAEFINKKIPGTYDTALTEAVRRKDKKITTLLLDNGADYRYGIDGAVMTGDFAMLTFLFSQGVPEKGLNPLHVYNAARYGQAKMVKYLMDKGISPDHRIPSGYSSLAIAAENGHRDVVRILLDANADIKYAQNYLSANQRHHAGKILAEELDEIVYEFFGGY